MVGVRAALLLLGVGLAAGAFTLEFCSTFEDEDGSDSVPPPAPLPFLLGNKDLSIKVTIRGEMPPAGRIPPFLGTWFY